MIASHVHACERTHPVFNNHLDPCGAYFNLGDGGNYEGPYVPWRSEVYNWTAFREASFGVAGLIFQSESRANFSWHRHACESSSGTNYHMNFSDSCVTYGDNSVQKMLTSDSFLIERPQASVCPNKHLSTKVSS